MSTDQHISAEVRERIVALYLEGYPYRDISRMVGRRETTIGQVCKRWRDANNAPLRKPVFWTPERLDELVEMVEAGTPIAEIAQKWSKTCSAIETQLYALASDRPITMPAKQAAEATGGTKGKADPETHFAMRMGKRRHSDVRIRPSRAPAARIPAWLPGAAMGASSLVDGGSLSGAGARSARGV